MKTKKNGKTIYVYAEHEKLNQLDGENQVIGAFLEWLNNIGYHLCENLDYPTEEDPESGMVHIRENTEQLLAKYFSIDLDKLEQEKRQMLDEIRNNTNSPKGSNED